MRILVDENVPESMVAALATAGHDVARVRDRATAMPDRDVLATAVAERRLLVTRDLDFGELVLGEAMPSAGVVVLRHRRDQVRELTTALLRLIAIHGERLTARFVLLRPDRARLRELPRRAR